MAKKSIPVPSPAEKADEEMPLERKAAIMASTLTLIADQFGILHQSKWASETASKALVVAGYRKNS